MPDDIVIEDEATFDFTDDEFLGILSWIKYFNGHYKIHGKKELPTIIFPIISKRIRMDFGLYIATCDVKCDNFGKHVVYISTNGECSERKVTVNSLIATWQL